ncbi:MAG: hypothetical protein RLZZ129_816 [Verrucomicrobiota bacterium]|jgi:hypothetical protein
MNRSHFLWLTIPLLGGLALAGCGKSAPAGGHEGHDHSAHSHAEGESPVQFKEGSGLLLSAETSAALGLKTGEVEERTVRHTYEVTASVFDAGPPARASSLVPVEIADDLEKHPPAEAKILAIHRELSSAVTQVEIVFAITGNPSVGSTISLTLRGPASTGTAVPRSALLRTATGSFVYVVNGANLLRTAVKPGASDGEYIEILDGLYAGDVVATAGVEQLWLTELRLTKGGGHSH